MGDINLFDVSNNQVRKLEGRTIGLEKTLQTLIESHCETFLGVRFLASEYSTGKNHGGRIDSLGIDENNCPVIIEYKRTKNSNVINQGLYYLDWLMDHQAQFRLLVQQKFGEEEAEKIDWSNARLICIASDYTKYDTHAVQQIERNIDLIKYIHYHEEMLLFELVNSTTGETVTVKEVSSVKNIVAKQLEYSRVVNNLSKASSELTAWYETIKNFTLDLGDDVTVKTLKLYFAFKRLKNFACVEIHPQANKLVLFLRLDPQSVELVSGFTRNVENIGHYGTGDVEVTIDSNEDIEPAQELISKAFELG